MNTKNYEPTQIAVKFANMVLVLYFLFFVLILLYGAYKLVNPPETVSIIFYVICIVCSGIISIVLALGLKHANEKLKVKLAVLMFTIGILVYGTEAVMELSPSLKEFQAKIMGIPYDYRKKTEVLDDLINSGVEAYPHVHPQHLLRGNTTKSGLPAKEGGSIFPLGGISNKLMVMTNECGYWMMYKGDRFGFHNSDKVYKNSKIDILMTGDSFTEGWSVKSEENIGSILNSLGYNVVNVGKSGNGPLLQFAALKEYAVHLKPKIVLWIYYANDLHDMVDEMRSSVLMKYLDDEFSQNLYFRQKEIDSALIKYVDSQWAKQRHDLVNKSYFRILRLCKIREYFHFTSTSPSLSKPSCSSIQIYADILNKANRIITEWGGELYFVSLPSFYLYSKESLPTSNGFYKYEKYNREIVHRIVNDNDISIIDIHNKVFAPHADPLSLFPFRTFGHYNAEGYRLVADAIELQLQLDGFSPINSTARDHPN